eukprot:scaffold172126_cov11-Prasinocladus_malaysianus.AAC.1
MKKVRLWRMTSAAASKGRFSKGQTYETQLAIRSKDICLQTCNIGRLEQHVILTYAGDGNITARAKLHSMSA